MVRHLVDTTFVAVWMIAVILILTACADNGTGLSSVPLVSGDPASRPPTVYTYPMPLCFILCTSHISAIRDDALVTGGGSFTDGTNSNAQSSGNMGGGSVTGGSNNQ
jgi:hypothetical protein